MLNNFDNLPRNWIFSARKQIHKKRGKILINPKKFQKKRAKFHRKVGKFDNNEKNENSKTNFKENKNTKKTKFEQSFRKTT